MDKLEKEVILSLGSGPKTVWWLATQLRVRESLIALALGQNVYNGFVEERGVEYLYPQTDRRDGSRRKRGKRLKTWTEKRTYYALTDIGRVISPIRLMMLGPV